VDQATALHAVNDLLPALFFLWKYIVVPLRESVDASTKPLGPATLCGFWKGSVARTRVVRKIAGGVVQAVFRREWGTIPGRRRNVANGSTRNLGKSREGVAAPGQYLLRLQIKPPAAGES
jgi:hypothetical protein